MRRVWSSVVAAVVALSPLVGQATVPLLACAAPDPLLAPSPRTAVAGVTPPLRTDADGSQTLTLLVEDPADVPGAYLYSPAATVQPEADQQAAGIFWHPWPGSPNLVTFGAYTTANGVTRRVPWLVFENGPAPDGVAAWLRQRVDDQEGAVVNATPFLINTLLPSSGLLNDAGVGEATMFGNTYPLDLGYTDRAPAYVWTVYRQAEGSQVWAGSVLMHSAASGDMPGVRYRCRRTRIGGVLRTNDGTTYLGGPFVTDSVRGSSAPGAFQAEQNITAGVTIGGAAWTDVPLVAVQQSERKSGESLMVYASEQRDEITIGTFAGDTFVPLAGTRADATHAAPPDAERRLVSVGAFDADGSYHPVAGARMRFEKVPGERWDAAWQNGGGPGSQAGDVAIDVGTFDPSGEFLPVAGATYADDFDGGLHSSQMMVTAGLWAAGTYRPLAGATYDGAGPLLDWLAADVAGDFSAMGPWLSSAGTFDPDGRYVPVAGASFAPGSNPDYGVVEEYRAGVFRAAYPDFVPLAGATWSSDRTSLSWAVEYANDGGHPPSNARVDAGAIGADGSYAPALSALATQGRPERYSIGAWAMGGFIPLLEACFAPDADGHSAAGVAIGSGPGRSPLVWAGTYKGSPAAGTGDCPAR